MVRKAAVQSSSEAGAAKTATRIYRVAHKETGDAIALVEATSAAQALSIVTGDLYVVDVPSQLQTAKLMENGVSLRLKGAQAS